MLQLGAIQTGGKGQKSIPVLFAGQPYFLTPAPLHVPFSASAYQNPEATRLNLAYTPTEELKQEIDKLDKQIKELLKPRLKEIFGPQADSIAAADEWYQSPLKTNALGYTSLRTKINTEGKNAVRCWNSRREQVPLPTDWSAHKVRPRIWVKNLYVLGREIGLILETCDAQLESITHHCPF